MALKVIICILAGFGAGVGTGFAGMSAATVIAPMLIAFLDVPAYQAIGIALTSDVLASAASAIAYGKHKNIDWKNGIILSVTVVLFTVLGSYASSFVPDIAMGSFSLVATLIMGIRFLAFPIMPKKSQVELKFDKKFVIKSILSGMVIGLICGFFGAGGGIMMLLALTSLLGYELKTAVGTSVLIMTFTALTGSVSHFVIGGIPDITCLIICIVSTLLFSILSALYANKASPKVLNRIVGIVLTILGAVMLVFYYVNKFATVA